MLVNEGDCYQFLEFVACFAVMLYQVHFYLVIANFLLVQPLQNFVCPQKCGHLFISAYFCIILTHLY